MIDQAIGTWITLAGILSVIIPLAAIVIWKIRFNGKILPWFMGALCYVFFAQMLLTFLNSYALAPERFNAAARGATMTYVFYMAVITAVVEEIGKFIVFKTIIKTCEDKEDAISFGLGHGGVQCMLVLGANCILLGMVFKAFNSGDSASLIQLLGSRAAVDNMTNNLASMGAGTLLLMLLENVLMMVFQTCSAFFVFKAARKPQSGMSILYAITAHAVIVVPAALNEKGVLPLWVTEIIILVITAAFAFFTFGQYKKYENMHTYDRTKSRLYKAFGGNQTTASKGYQPKGNTKKRKH